MDLKLKDLRYLVAVADTRHFGRAAAQCFVSQPTLSAQLRKLEEYLGVQLVERQPRNLVLTRAGEAVVARARRMLDAGKEIVDIAQTWRDPLSGSLRLAVLPTIGPYLLPQVLGKVRKALPRVELLLYEHQTKPMLEELREGTIDLGILALPIEADGLVTRKLYDEPFLLAVPAQHRLASQAQARASDLDGETLLLLEDGHCLRDQALAFCERRGVQEKQDFRATSIETLRQMVATGAGVTLLPALATHGAYGSARGIRLLPFVRPAPSRIIGAVWRATTARSAVIDTLCGLIAKHSGLT